MTEATAVKAFLDYLEKLQNDKKELFDEPKKVSLQISLHKIPNLMNTKQILCKLPHSLNLNESKSDPQICLIVKDTDKKDRDYEKTVRKYKNLIDSQGLGHLITMIVPLKQLNLEFRHFEAKRKLCTSFDLFLSDKCLHDILFSGSKLGKEFRKRKRMPIEIDLDSPNLKETIENVINSTMIQISGKGPIIDINTFLSNHTVEQAVENIIAVKSQLLKHLPGGESNIKSIHIKSTDTISIPVYIDPNWDPNQVKIANNMTPNKIKKTKKLKLKRLGSKKPKKSGLSTDGSSNKSTNTTNNNNGTNNSNNNKPKLNKSSKKASTKKPLKKSVFIK